jgi:hypothetical protein
MRYRDRLCDLPGLCGQQHTATDSGKTKAQEAQSFFCAQKNKICMQYAILLGWSLVTRGSHTITAVGYSPGRGGEEAGTGKRKRVGTCRWCRDGFRRKMTPAGADQGGK